MSEHHTHLQPRPRQDRGAACVPRTVSALLDWLRPPSHAWALSGMGRGGRWPGGGRPGWATVPPFLSVGSVCLCPGEGDADGPLGPGPELGGLWGTLDEHTASLSPSILLAAVAATRSWTVSQRCLVFCVLPSCAELSLSVCLVLGGALWPPHALPPGKAAPHRTFNTTCTPSVSKCLCPAKFHCPTVVPLSPWSLRG